MNQHLRPSVLCLGEALVDVVIRPDSQDEFVGGSPLNVACVLTGLGHDASIGAWWGKDERGQRIEAYAAEHDVKVVPGSDGAERTTVAYAKLDAEGRADYEFDLLWELPELNHLDQVNHLHTGSIAATLEPGGTQVLEAVRAVQGTATVSYDPNIRPSLMECPTKVLKRIEELVELADVVKVSDEDLAWLYGEDHPVEKVMREWITSGPGLVVVTRGPWGAYALLKHNRDLLVIDQMNVEVGDTVGAGDSFMGGLISGLLDAGLLGSERAGDSLRHAQWGDVQSALHRAVITSGLTVSRNGAYAPTRAEVEAVILADHSLR